MVIPFTDYAEDCLELIISAFFLQKENKDNYLIAGFLTFYLWTSKTHSIKKTVFKSTFIFFSENPSHKMVNYHRKYILLSHEFKVKIFIDLCSANTHHIYIW